MICDTVGEVCSFTLNTGCLMHYNSESWYVSPMLIRIANDNVMFASL